MNHLDPSAIIRPSPDRPVQAAAIRHPHPCATREAGAYYGRMRQALGSGHSVVWKRGMAVSWRKVKKQENRGNFCDSESHKFLDPAREAIRASRDVSRLPRFSCFFTLRQLTVIPRFQTTLCPLPKAPPSA